MSMRASIHGFVTSIKAVQTKTGKPMTMASLACKLPVVKSEDEVTEWIRIIAFGDNAEELAKLGASNDGKGYASVYGTMQVSKWEKNGEPVDTLQMVADGLITARSARPKGGRPKDPLKGARKALEGETPAAFDSLDRAKEMDPFGDEIPF